MFYAKIIKKEILIEELDSLTLSQEEKIHLSALIDSSLHHAILDEVLSHLSNDDKKLFLKVLADEKDHQKVLEFLKERIENVEDKIEKISEQLIKEMHADVKEAKKSK